MVSVHATRIVVQANYFASFAVYNKIITSPLFNFAIWEITSLPLKSKQSKITFALVRKSSASREPPTVTSECHDAVSTYFRDINMDGPKTFIICKPAALAVIISH